MNGISWSCVDFIIRKVKYGSFFCFWFYIKWVLMLKFKDVYFFLRIILVVCGNRKEFVFFFSICFLFLLGMGCLMDSLFVSLCGFVCGKFFGKKIITNGKVCCYFCYFVFCWEESLLFVRLVLKGSRIVEVGCR